MYSTPFPIEDNCTINFAAYDGIHDGTEAQNASTQRFFGLLNDQEWKTTVENLGKYCDNDVRAMVAVEYFLNNILNGKIKL